MIHGGLLCRPERDAADIEEHGIRPIALAVINLYPFRQAASRLDAVRDDVIEQIDVGGPAMIRAAAKNHERVGVVVDPADYSKVVAELEAAGELSEATRRRLAAKAFDHTARYDRAIAAGWSGKRAVAMPCLTISFWNCASMPTCVMARTLISALPYIRRKAQASRAACGCWVARLSRTTTWWTRNSRANAPRPCRFLPA